MLYLKHKDKEKFDALREEKGDEILPTEMVENSIQIYEPPDNSVEMDASLPGWQIMSSQGKLKGRKSQVKKGDQIEALQKFKDQEDKLIEQMNAAQIEAQRQKHGSGYREKETKDEHGLLDPAQINFELSKAEGESKKKNQLESEAMEFDELEEIEEHPIGKLDDH